MVLLEARLASALRPNGFSVGGGTEGGRAALQPGRLLSRSWRLLSLGVLRSAAFLSASFTTFRSGWVALLLVRAREGKALLGAAGTGSTARGIVAATRVRWRTILRCVVVNVRREDRDAGGLARGAPTP